MIPSASVDAAQLIARMESVPFTRWHTKCRIVMKGERQRQRVESAKETVNYGIIGSANAVIYL